MGLATPEQVQAALETLTGAQIADLPEIIEAVGAAIEGQAGQAFAAGDVDEWRNGRGADKIVLDRWPVITFAELWIEGQGVIEPEHYRVDRARGELYLIGRPFPRGRQNVRAKYRAGYEAGQIPADLTRATILWIKALHDGVSVAGTKSSESFAQGEYAYTLRSNIGKTPDFVAAAVANHRR